MAAMNPLRKAVTAAEIIAIEKQWFASGEITVDQLMEKVGQAIADWLLDNFELSPDELNVLALVGKGNNGGDALVAARHLLTNGTACVLGLCLDRDDDDPLMRAAIDSGANFIDLSSDYESEALAVACARADVILDGVFGFSISRPIDERLGGIFRIVENSGKRVVAIDLPSGADPDTGHFDPNGLPASVVLPVGLHKIGPAIRFGDQCYGEEISVLDVGMPPEFSEHVASEAIDKELARSLLPLRRPTGHKGDFGRALIYAGSRHFVGAAVMATRSCLRSGVGLVALMTPESVYQILAGDVPEATFIPLPDSLHGEIDESGFLELLVEERGSHDSFLMGPGLGQSESVRRSMKRLLSDASKRDDVSIVLDADALNIASETPGWWRNFNSGLVITPHPGEMSRIMGCSVREVEEDRLGIVKEAAQRFNCVAVLKGAVTLIANPEGQVRINMMVNDGLAKGGSGDVLAGLITGLAAQIDPFDAAVLGVHLHSIAGMIARDEKGSYAMTASDVIENIPDAFLQLAS